MFEDPNKAEEMLRRRTSKILGGYVSEKIFLNTFVLPHNIEYTKGWWLSKEKISGHLWFFVVKNNLSPLDHRIIHILEHNDYAVCQILCKNNKCEIINKGKQISFTEFLQEYGIPTSTANHYKRNDDEALNRCIQYLYESDMLTDTATSIYIEDEFLNRYFYTTNIDLFLQNPVNDHPICIEIKFKNEFVFKDGDTKRKVFGEDTMQYETLFPLLRNCDIDVYNCILYNHIKSQHNTNTTDIFNFLDNNQGCFYWKKKKMESNEQHSRHKLHVNYTSWHSDTERYVYCIPLKEYSAIDTDFFRNSPNNYWGICPICGANMVLRCKNDNTAEFFGCINFKKH